MKIKGNILITDPCYIDNHTGINFIFKRNTICGDWSCLVYKGTEEENKQRSKDFDERYFKFFKEYNFTHKNNNEKKELVEEFNKEKEEFKEKYTYGEFCADSGEVCVCILEEALAKNDNLNKWIKEHNWCATIINDFDGDIFETIDDNEKLHIIGSGNKPFFTAQYGI